ncbi:hypothetical protein D915_009989 [Fasciola hepatica]|uniref:Thioredoxin domain-containing protein 17 n=1 Tax=Fasciola hepatica TaxID=6192 RepID=A0A4E0QUX0_FASHE|nr:hypothetical protein D915_009989 [Fasciola hepatica]
MHSVTLITKLTLILFVAFELQVECARLGTAEPIVKSALSELPENAEFVVVEVGFRDAWKNSSNPFRRNKACNINSIPTIIQFGTKKRLTDEDIECREKIVNLFKEVS